MAHKMPNLIRYPNSLSCRKITEHSLRLASGLSYITRSAGRVSNVIIPMLLLLIFAARPDVSEAQCDYDDHFYSDGEQSDSNGVRCITIKIVAGPECHTNPHKVDGGIDTVIITDLPPYYRTLAPSPWMCSFTFDSANPYTGASSDPADHFINSNWGYRSGEDHDSMIWYANTESDDIYPNDSGWLSICVCCGWGKVEIPILITVKHHDGSVSYQNVYPTYYSEPCGVYPYLCTDSCDVLNCSAISKDLNSGEYQFCATVTRQSGGAVGDFTLYWKWPLGCPKDSMRLISAPSGWSQVSGGVDSSSFAVDTSIDDAIQNCGSGTFCFALSGCTGTEDLCSGLTVDMHTDGEPWWCSSPCSLTVPTVPDNSCCSSAVEIEPTTIFPAPDTTNGSWSFCIDVHESDNLPDTVVSFNLDNNLPLVPARCITPTNIPWGWRQVSQVGTTWTYKLDSVASVDSFGCRTYEWCFQTCDCQNTSFTNAIQVIATGTVFNTSVTFPVGIAGNCCGGDTTTSWHSKDYVTVTGLTPTCVQVTFQNTHYALLGVDGCCEDNSFTFVLPPGCTVTSVTPLTSGWCWDTVGSTVQIFGCPAGGFTPLPCCSSLVVNICTDCPIGFSNWITNWTGADNCGDTTGDTVSYCGGCGGGGKIADQPSAPGQNTGSPNYPNPFGSGTNFTTTIPFTTSASGVATIRIVDEKGNVILTEDQDVTYNGTHFFYFTGNDLPSGTYYYQIEFPKGVVIVNRSMLLVK